MSDTPAPTETEPADAAPAPPPTRYGALVVSANHDVLHTSPDALLAVVDGLRADGFAMCTDVVGVDYLDHPGRGALPAAVTPERFEVVYGFINHGTAERVRVRVQVPGVEAVVPTLFDRYPGTEAQERETYDLVGIVFDGHPDLTRILMPEDWRGHPLRRDYDVGRIPVQFKGAPAPR
jgi:NADH-quinone oxidoreductase subunit C